MKTININWIEIDMLTYRLLDLYWLYVWDYNNLEEIKKAINNEIETRQKIKYKKEMAKPSLIRQIAYNTAYSRARILENKPWL